MKHPALLLLVAIALAAPSPMRAQQPAPPPSEATPKPDAPKPPSTEPGADPFIRDGKKTGPSAPKPEVPEVRKNVYALIEYIEVPREAWLAWSRANPIKGDAIALRAEVQKWIAAGKAKPVELGCIATKSGQRTVLESIVERRYPGGYFPATPTPLPVDLQTINTHLTFEWEPVEEPDGFIDSNFVPQLISYCGDEQWTPAGRDKPVTGGVPRLSAQKATLSITSAPSQPMLVQVITPLDEVGKTREEARVLLFLRTAGIPVKVPAAAPNTTAKAPAATEKNPEGEGGSRNQPRPPSVVSSTFELERMEVTLADLNLWFASQPLGTATDGLRVAALEWIHAGRGRELDRLFNPFLSGQRSAFEPGREFRFPSAFAVEGYTRSGPPPVVPLRNPLVVPASFEKRGLGNYVEMEPVSSEDGRLTDLNAIISNVRHCGNVVLHRGEIDGKLVPDMEQPIFGLMRVTTSVAIANGEPLLIAIHTPADDQGRPQPERKILTFVTTRP